MRLIRFYVRANVLVYGPKDLNINSFATMVTITRKAND
jgi:hypothetical protein